MAVRWTYQALTSPLSPHELLQKQRSPPPLSLHFLGGYLTPLQIVRGVFAGVTTGLVMLEAQCVFIAIPADCFLLSLTVLYTILFCPSISTTQDKTKRREMDHITSYVCITSTMQLLVFVFWDYSYGGLAKGFIEPSELHRIHGLSVVDVLSFGLNKRAEKYF